MTQEPENNVVNLGSFLSTHRASATAMPNLETGAVGWVAAEQRVATGTLNASVHQRVHPDDNLSRFLDVAATALSLMESCAELLHSRDFLGADDLLMKNKLILSEFLMFRDISDSVGLISLKCFQAASQIKAVTDAPSLPNALIHALQRIWSAPFMNFDEACALADEIDRAVSSLNLPGYLEVTEELIADARVQEPT